METRCIITKDPKSLFGEGSSIKARDLLEEFFKTCSASVKDWLYRIPFAEAVRYAADSLGIGIRFV